MCGPEFVKYQCVNINNRTSSEEPFVNVVLRTVESETCMLSPFQKLIFYEGLG